MIVDYLFAGPEPSLVVALLVTMLLTHEGGHRSGGRVAARGEADTTSQVDVVVAAMLAP
jgi:hypothetical protein